MAENVLVPGKPRLGWLVDGDETTPDIAVMLEDTGSQIEVTVPTKGMFGRDDPYRRWFSDSISFGDDPDRTKYAYRPPAIIQVHDKDGPVVLVGCRSSGHWMNLTGPGQGKIVASFAILGARHLNYSRINGLRAEFPALASWTGLRSVRTEPKTDGTGRVQRVEVILDSPPSQSLSRRMNLALRPTWRTSYPDTVGTFAAHDVVELMTATKVPRPWEDHIDQLAAIRELLALSAWRRFGFSRLAVNRGDDPERVLSGDAIGERWAEASTHRLPKHEPWSRAPDFLFSYDDIGDTGVRRWIRLRDHFQRSLRPLVGLTDQPNSYLEVKLVQSGIALEALGYQIAVDQGKVKQGKRLQQTYADAIRTILNDMVYVPLTDPGDWVTRSTDHYRGTKHADNQTPDAVEAANTMRENLLVARFWLAGRLGVKREVLESRLERDPMANPYISTD